MAAMQEDMFSRIEAKLSKLYQVYDNTEAGGKLDEMLDQKEYRIESLGGLLQSGSGQFNLLIDPVMDLATSGCSSDCYEVYNAFTVVRW
jgi:hypothetical protein